MSDEQRYHIGADDKPHKCTARTPDSCPLKVIGTVHGTLKEVTDAIEDKATLAAMKSGPLKLSKSTSRTTAAATPAQSKQTVSSAVAPSAVDPSTQSNGASAAVNAAAGPALSKSASPTSGAVAAGHVIAPSNDTSPIAPTIPARRLHLPERQKQEYAALRDQTRDTVDRVMAAGTNLHSILSGSYDSLEDAVGVSRGVMVGDSGRLELERSSQYRINSWPGGKLSPDDLYATHRTRSTRSSAVIVLNGRLESMVRDGWTLPDKSAIDAEQNRIWQSLPRASRRGLRKSDVRGLAIVQAGYEPGSDSKIGNPSDPASLTQQTLSYSRRARGMEDDGTPLSSSASRDALDLMQITAQPWDDGTRQLLRGNHETRYQYNLRPDGVALWRVAMVQNAMADGRDLSDNAQWARDVAEPEALMGMTGSMVSKFGGKLPQEARAWLGTNPDWQIRPTRMVN